MTLDPNNLPTWAVGFLTFLSLAGLGFVKVYSWIQTESQKQRGERASDIEKATESIRREFEARIMALEAKIKDYEARHKTINVECAKGLELMSDVAASPADVRSCFRRILESIG